MIGELLDGVAALAGTPPRLFGGEPGDRCFRGYEPVCLVVRGAKLLEQNAAKIGGGLFVLRNGAERDSQQQGGNEIFHDATSDFEMFREVYCPAPGRLGPARTQF